MPHWVDLLPVALVLVATITDIRRREIPDLIWIAIVLLVPIRVWWLWPEITIWHLPLGGFVALLVGCLVAGNERFGGGDVKLFAALGTWFGVGAVAPLALWIGIAGLPLAIAAALRNQNDFAYGPAILVATTLHAFVPNLLGRIGGWA